MDIAETFAVRQLVQPGNVVFDVGANKGVWTDVVLAHTKDVTIHAFEPSKAVYQYAACHPRPNNIKLNKMAVADVDDPDMTFYECEKNFEWSCLLKQDNHTPIQVVCTTLDTYCEKSGVEHIDFLKIDVEGAELQVFRGAKRLLTERRVTYMQFEFNICAHKCGYVWSDVVKELAQYDAHLWHVYPHGLVPLADVADDMDMTESIALGGEKRRQANVVVTFSPGRYPNG